MMIWAPTSFSAKCKPDILYSEAFVNIFLKIHLAVYDLFAASLHKYASGGNKVIRCVAFGVLGILAVRTCLRDACMQIFKQRKSSIATSARRI